eukprot:gene14266-19142_t
MAFDRKIPIKRNINTKLFSYLSSINPVNYNPIPDQLHNLIGNIDRSRAMEDYAMPLWETIKYEASAFSDEDIRTISVMANAVLSQPNLNDAIIDYVSNQLETPFFQATQIRNLFAEVVAQNNNGSIASAWALDLVATALCDYGDQNLVDVLLFNRGYLSLVTYRIANALWYSGRDGLARYFQSLVSQKFCSDIHPACQIGTGIIVSRGCGVVIGETAVVGDDCLIAHGVTLGGTGKQSGDRHPKIGKGVSLLAGATVLGNTRVGDGAIVSAHSVVTKPVEAYTRVRGVPARLVSILKVNISDMNEDTKKYLRRATEYNNSNIDDDLDIFPQVRINYHSFSNGSIH